MKEVVWGMVGCGAVTKKKSGPGLYKSAYSRVKGVYARHRENAVDYAKRHNIPTVFGTAAALFADRDITAVYISIPPNAHKDYALACIAAGKIPYIEILDSGALGKIRFVRFNQFMRPETSDTRRRGETPECNTNGVQRPNAGGGTVDLDSARLPWRVIPSISSGGKFVDMMVHVIDIVQFFFGDIVDVQGFAANKGGLYQAEDTVCASFRSQSGILISGAGCYVFGYDDEELFILGEKGRICTPGLAYKPVQVTIGGKEETLKFTEPEHIAQPYEQSGINEIIGFAQSNADAKSAANNVRVVDEILSEYRRLRA